MLKSLGRIHTVAEAKAAIAIARGNFDRFSFDLIYARPGQTVDEWRGELAEALALAGGHLSLYQLTIEPETPFAALHAAGKLVVPDGDAALALYDVTQELTQAAGLPAYEISNHAAPGEESRHNLLYWRYGEYVGCGPGAHGRLVLDGVRHATSAERHPERWVERVEREGHGWVEATPLTRAEESRRAASDGLAARRRPRSRPARRERRGQSLACRHRRDVGAGPRRDRLRSPAARGASAQHRKVASSSTRSCCASALSLEPERRAHSPMDNRSAAD